MDKILFMVEWGNAHCLVYARDREDAKRQAQNWIGSDMNKYTVEPLTEPGDRVHLAITLYV